MTQMRGRQSNGVLRGKSTKTLLSEVLDDTEGQSAAGFRDFLDGIDRSIIGKASNSVC